MSKIISVTEKYPQLLESWDYDKNKEYPKDIPCCTGKLKTCGKLSNGTKLEWKYV